MKEINKRLERVNRRTCLKGLAVGSASLAGIGGFTMKSSAQNGEPVPKPVSSEERSCARPMCPPGLNIAYTRKYGEWWPDTYDDIGEKVNPDDFSIEGDKKKITIRAPFPFAVSYATRKKRHNGRHCWGDEKNHHDKKHRDRKQNKHHGDPTSCDCFKDCKEHKPVTAEPIDGQFCATISCVNDGKRKKESKICWFRVHCPDENGKNHENADNNLNNDSTREDKKKELKAREKKKERKKEKRKKKKEDSKKELKAREKKKERKEKRKERKKREKKKERKEKRKERKKREKDSEDSEDEHPHAC